MRSRWTLICSLILVAAITGLWACGSDDDPIPTGPSRVTLTPPPGTPQITAPMGNPTPPASPQPPAPVPPSGGSITGDGEFAYSTITNNLGKDEDFGLCCYVGDMNDLNKQTLVGDPPMIRLRPGQSYDFEAPLGCGRINQCDNLFNINGGECPEKPPHKNKTLNSKPLKGDECPKKQCPANAFVDVVVALPSQPEHNPRECLDWYPVTYTINSNLPTVIESIPPEYVPSKGLPVKAQTYSVTFSAVGKSNGEVCARDSETVTVPGCECTPCQSVVKASIDVSKNSGSIIVSGDTPYPSTIIMPDGSTRNVGPGSFSFNAGAAKCNNTYTASIKAYDGMCGGEPILCSKASDSHTTGDCPCEGVDLSGNSSINGNNLVTASVNDVPGSSATEYFYKRHNMGSPQTTTMPWSESFQLSCDGSYQVTVRAYDGKKKCDEVVLTENAAGCSQCVLPGPGSGVLELPNSNPETECGHFGLIPGNGGFFVSKCGQFYQWGSSPASGQCINGQDVSHVRECMCPPS